MASTARPPGSRFRGPLTELPRFTQLGPGSGIWHSIYVEGARIRVHRRFFMDVAAADAVLATR